MDLADLNESRPEKNCDEHTIRESIVYRNESVIAPRHDLLANILRSCAVYADGLCAEKDAEDVKILTTGLVLHFSAESKRMEFWKYVEQFVPLDLRMKIIATPGRKK